MFKWFCPLTLSSTVYKTNKMSKKQSKLTGWMKTADVDSNRKTRKDNNPNEEQPSVSEKAINEEGPSQPREKNGKSKEISVEQSKRNNEENNTREKAQSVDKVTSEEGSSQPSEESRRRKEFLDVHHLDRPNQPNKKKFPMRYPKDNKSGHGRSFQSQWFEHYKWLHYDEHLDAAFCFSCLKAAETNSLSQSSLSQSDAFTKNGFTNWKAAMDKSKGKGKKGKGFAAHKETEAHKEAEARYINTSPISHNIIEMTSTQMVLERKNNRKMFLKILSNVRYLARQSQAFRGNWNEKDGAESDSNSFRLLMLRSEDDSSITEWLNRKTDKYTSPTIQNEMISAMALGALREISENIQNATFFTVMADETADVSNKEQLVICIRWIDDDLCCHEDFIGIKPIARCTANQIVEVIKNVLADMHLKLENCRGQCYDGASVMSGHKSGVSAQIKAINGRALYTHCYGHALNLCVKDACTKVTSLRETFGMAKEITKLVKKSPQRETHLKALKVESENSDPGVHAFCETRWTIRGSTLLSINNNHKELMTLWKDSLDILKDLDMKARIIGAQWQMKTFEFYFGCCLGEMILSQTDNLSKALQKKELSAAEGQYLAERVVETLRKDRNDERFSLFWDLILLKMKGLDIGQPTISRKRKQPSRYDSGSEPYHPVSPKEYFRKTYFEAYDFVINAIVQRFNQPDYKMYAAMQNIVLMSIKGEDFESEMDREIFDGVSFRTLYNDDIDMYTLKIQLRLMQSIAKDIDIDIPSVLEMVRKMGKAKWTVISEVITLIKLLLLAPATNAESERVFSGLRRVKTYLRSTMGDIRLNCLMVLHIHKEKNDKLDLVDIGNKFVGNIDSRKRNFGTFVKQDLYHGSSNPSRLRHVACQTEVINDINYAGIAQKGD